MLESAWRKGWSDVPTLDPEELWAKALKDENEAGEASLRTAHDIADFRLRLDAICASLSKEAKLNALGLTFAHGQLVRVIRQRLRLGSLWNRKPELAATPLASPIIVIGQMRSGTTRIHRLLAADPAHAATRFCDSWQPVPCQPDTRPIWSALSLSFARALDPWLDAIHPFGVTQADEELGWLAGALDHCAYEAQWHIPAFTAFSEARDPAPIYREFARILRMDAAWRGNAHLPRVLKVPQFAEDLPALLAQFPEARIVRAQRCEDEVAQSAASLLANQMTMQSDSISMNWIEQECRRKIALRRARMDSALAQFSGLQTQVDFTALDADWQSAIGTAYHELGLEFTPGAIAAMQNEQGRAAKSSHGEHAAAYRNFAEAPL